MAKKKKLTKSQLAIINENHNKLAIENLQLKLLEKDKNILELRQEIFKSQIALLNSEIDKIKLKANQVRSNKVSLEKSGKIEIEKIKTHHKIKGSLGFDPDTGEIKEEPNV